MKATNNDHDGHNHDGHLGEIYQTTLSELNCTFGVSFSRFQFCSRHGHGLFLSWFVAIMVCGRHGIRKLFMESFKVVAKSW